jgi:hypothetical protein
MLFQYLQKAFFFRRITRPRCTIFMMLAVQGRVQPPLHALLHEEGGDEGGGPALSVRRGAVSGE